MRNIEILERNTIYQNKYLPRIINALWYVSNRTLRHDLNVPHVKDEIRRFSQRYADRMEEHPKIFTTNLMKNAKSSHREKKDFLKTYATYWIIIL